VSPPPGQIDVNQKWTYGPTGTYHPRIPDGWLNKQVVAGVLKAPQIFDYGVVDFSDPLTGYVEFVGRFQGFIPVWIVSPFSVTKSLIAGYDAFSQKTNTFLPYRSPTCLVRIGGVFVNPNEYRYLLLQSAGDRGGSGSGVLMPSSRESFGVVGIVITEQPATQPLAGIQARLIDYEVLSFIETATPSQTPLSPPLTPWP